MSKQLISNYTYNTTSKTVTLTDFTTVSLDRLQLITDVTTNTIIYNFADSSVATATVSGNVITLSAAPGSNTDKLMVIYDAASGDPVYDGYLELASLSAGSLNADLVPSTDVSGYRWVSVQVFGTFSATVSFQGSNDNSTWQNIPLSNTGSISNTLAATANSAGIYHGPISFRYFRVRATSYTSGTVQGVVELWTVPTTLHTQGVAAQQSGTWSVGSNSATGSAVPANAFYMGAINAAGNLTGVRMADIGDGISNIFTAGMQPYIYNGTNADRAKSATSAAGTTGTGVPAAGMLGFDGTNYQRALMGTDGKTYIRLSDGFGNVLSQATPSDTMSAAPTNLLGVVNLNTVYNGTNYVRMRGDTTGTYTVSRPTTSGGVTVAKIASAATTNATSVKASAGQVYGWSLFNTSASTKYLKFYNKATAPTVGTDVPVFIVPIAASGSVNIMLGDIGTPLATGIAYAITGAVADTDTTAVALNDVVGSVFYS